jgi:hypothetical protein
VGRHWRAGRGKRSVDTSEDSTSEVDGERVQADGRLVFEE